jgi:hypothetical protein
MAALLHLLVVATMLLMAGLALLLAVEKAALQVRLLLPLPLLLVLLLLCMQLQVPLRLPLQLLLLLLLLLHCFQPHLPLLLRLPPCPCPCWLPQPCFSAPHRLVSQQQLRQQLPARLLLQLLHLHQQMLHALGPLLAAVPAAL